MSSPSTGASTLTQAGSGSGSAAEFRATWIPPCCSALSRASWPGLGASCGRRVAGRVTSSPSATASSRAARSKISRRWSRQYARVWRSMPDPTAVIAMAYGSPDGEEGVEPYYTHIRGGRPPSPEALAQLRERYRVIGGSPLTAITQAQARALADRLELPGFAGVKHAPPFIAGAAAKGRAAGMTQLVGLALAPHYADLSLGAYEASLRDAWDGELIFVRGFHDHPSFIAAVRMLLAEAMTDFAPERVFFTAHSLPARIEAAGDRYRARLLG